VDLIARRFRGVLIAVVVLGLSAGAVFAGHVVLQAPATAPTTAEQGDQNEQGDENATETPEPAETPDANETPEPPDAAETDGTGAPGDNHGALVSAAAQMATPVFTTPGAMQFANHGAFVSCVAHVKTLPTGMTIAAFLLTVTPETCAQAAAADKAAKVHGKAGKHTKGHKQG
jgi:hypothetical protein